MAFDEGVAQRVREIMEDIPSVAEKKMFGGIAFMVNGTMCGGVVKTELMMRVGADGYEDALQQAHAREMDFTGRPLKGMVYVSAEGLASDDELESWVTLGTRFAETLPPK